MNWQLTRRDLVAVLGSTLAARALPAGEATAPGKACLTLTYLNNNPANKNIRFNAEAFREKYVPALRKAYGNSLERVELRMPEAANRPKGLGVDVPANMPTPIAAAVSMWINDAAAFAAANQSSGGAITTELQKVTNGQPHVQFEEVISEYGQPRTSVPMGTVGQVILYPYTEGAKWDADYYVNTYLPKMATAYGEEALKRVEVRRGVGVPGGGKPLFINVVQVYAENAAKFQGAAFRTGGELMADAMKISTITPIMGNVNVLGVG